jgi:RNA polymerase sigma-70 factor, ECF subfamily
MHETSKTLLEKLRDPQDAGAWQRFVELYVPLLFYWARQLPLKGAGPEDLVQDILLKLVQKLPEFKYDRERGSFRNWLQTLCQNHWRDHWRKPANRVRHVGAATLEAVEVPDLGLERFWNEDYYGLLVAETFKILETEFDSTTRTAFAEVVLNGRPVNEVARQLGLAPNAVSVRKFRVLQRLRQELAEFA